MKEYITNVFKSLRDKGVFMWIVVIFLIIIIGIGFSKCGSDTAPKKDIELPNVVVNGDDDGHTNDSVKSVDINATTGLVFDAGTKLQNIPITNPENNKCAMVCSIYLADGDAIFSSKKLEPGEEIGQVTINTILRKGLYKDASIVYSCFDENGRILTQCSFGLELRVI